MTQFIVESVNSVNRDALYRNALPPCNQSWWTQHAHQVHTPVHKKYRRLGNFFIEIFPRQSFPTKIKHGEIFCVRKLVHYILYIRVHDEN
jgi:hypothetical protein